MTKVYTDCLIIGAGLAGEKAALKIAENGHNVILLSVVPPRRSHSCGAQGGMQAALGNSIMSQGDSPALHFEDTVKGACGGADEDAVDYFVNAAPNAISELESFGVPWTRISSSEKRQSHDGLFVEPETKEGLITARNFGGTKKWRACFCSAGTGRAMINALDSQISRIRKMFGTIEVHDKTEAIKLLVKDSHCYGAIAANYKNSQIISYFAKAVLIATGGYGALFRDTTNSSICEGMGHAMLYEAGGTLANLEAVQFHPTGITPSGILITEGCRGDGGYLLDKNLDRFMLEYEPELKELAPRDVVSRCIINHISKGLGVSSDKGDHVWLDIRHLGKGYIKDHLKEVDDICKTFLKIDPSKHLIPVHPVQHYTMGGIRTDINCHCSDYGVTGLFAAGEAACWDIHGFNRLGGNSLAETVVAGKLAGENMMSYIKSKNFTFDTAHAEAEMESVQAELLGIGNRKSPINKGARFLRKEVKALLTENVGILRTKTKLKSALNSLDKLLQAANETGVSSDNAKLQEVIDVYKMRRLLPVAVCIAVGALERRESRGAHFREDFPSPDDANFKKRFLYKKDFSNQSNLPLISFEEIRTKR